jgi:alpha-L-fucosidase 2
LPNLVMNVMLWALHLWHQAYVYKGYDKDELRHLFPLLARAVTYYSHITKLDSTTGVLHIDPAKSPEYGDASDADYDVSLLRWGLNALIDAADKAAFQPALDDYRLSMWRGMAASLTTYPTDPSTGFLIGQGQELAKGHLHFSHLMMFWPLKLLNLSEPAVLLRQPPPHAHPHRARQPR